MEFVFGLVAGLAQRFGGDPRTLFLVLLMFLGFGIIGAAAALTFYWLRSRIAIAEQEAGAAARERAEILGSYQRQSVEANERLRVLMNGKLDGLTTVITKTGVSLDNISASLVALHDKEDARAGKLYGKLEEIRLDIARRPGS